MYEVEQVYTCHAMHMEARGKLWQLVLSFHHVSPSDQTWLFWLYVGKSFSCRGNSLVLYFLCLEILKISKNLLKVISENRKWQKRNQSYRPVTLPAHRDGLASSTFFTMPYERPLAMKKTLPQMSLQTFRADTG